MHKTLKAETTKAPAHNEASQQKRFDDFVHEYNDERFHEALERKCSDEIYQPSIRSFPERQQPIVYDKPRILGWTG